MLTPAQVRNHQFSASGRGTYRAAEVDDFFASVCDSYEQMFRENGELLKKIGLLADKVEEYKSDEDNIREALLTAQRMANKIISDAKADVEKRLSDASQKAEQLTNDAQQKADDAITSAQKTAEALLSDSRKKADEILNDAQRKADERINAVKRSVTHETLVLEMTKREVSEFRASLVAMYKNHIELINKIPFIVENESEPENKQEDVSAFEQEKEQNPEPVFVPEDDESQEEKGLERAFADDEPVFSQETQAPAAEEDFTKEDEATVYENEEVASASEENDNTVSEDIGFAMKFDDTDAVIDADEVADSQLKESEYDIDDDDDGYETISPDSSDKDDYGEEPISFRNLFKRK